MIEQLSWATLRATRLPYPPLIERRPPSKRVPSTTLRDTFISLISEIKLKSDLGRCTFEEGVRLVVHSNASQEKDL